MPIGAARDRRLMQPAEIALPRTIAGRMAVGAARMGQHLAKFGEHRRLSGIRIGNEAQIIAIPRFSGIVYAGVSQGDGKAPLRRTVKVFLYSS